MKRRREIETALELISPKGQYTASSKLINLQRLHSPRTVISICPRGAHYLSRRFPSRKMSGGYEYGGYGGGGGDSYSGGMDAMTGNNYGGGGFMDDIGNSGNKATEKKASRDAQSLLPVSIKQLQSATNEEDQNKIDGADLHTVVIMGMVESIEEHSTNVNFKINDGTGSVEGKLWNDKDSSNGLGSKIANCRENAFVRIVGQLREYEGRKHVLIYDIAPINDWNELTHHLLQIVLVHLQNTKGPIPGTGGQSSMQGGNNFNNQQNFQNQNQNQNQNHNQNHDQKPQMRGGVIKDEHATLKEKIKNVFDTGKYDRQSGLTIKQIVAHLGQSGMPNMSEWAIQSVCRIMTDDGVIYTTIDEDHFLST